MGRQCHSNREVGSGRVSGKGILGMSGNCRICGSWGPPEDTQVRPLMQ